jgi:hypothetical protein
LDRYGGRKDIKCSAHSRAWHTEKIGDHWWICTPDGYAFFAQDVELIIPTDDIAAKRVDAKYGSLAVWSEATLDRVKDWGFNTIGAYAHNIMWPVITDKSFPTDSKGRQTHKIKLPFLAETRAAFYSTTNPAIRLETGKEVRFLIDPVKNIFGARSSFYNGYVPGGGVADYYDPKIQTWMNDDFAQNSAWGYIKNGPNNDYLMGIIGDDGDQMFGFANGPDFPTLPPGKNNPSLALLILSESPVQTCNSDRGFVYADTTMSTKRALHDMLKSKYDTVTALNAAWGSSYTTLDSSGTQITEEFVATGDGSTLTFSHRLGHPNPSKYSVQIFANHVPVGGDTGDEKVYGPNLTGTVAYRSGSLDVTFKPNQAPGKGVPITVSYVQNGWGIGTGLMDEDMRPAHQSWLGNTWDGLNPISRSLKQMNAGVKADLDAFLKQTAEWYFKMLRDGIHSQFPNALVLVEIGTWSGLPPAPVLQAAGEYVDLFEDDEANLPFNQAKLDYVMRNYGDKPFMAGAYLAANLDSAFGSSGNAPPVGSFPTQAQKGEAYYKAVSAFLQAKYPSGTNPHVGFILWSWMDMWGEKTNWGLVSHLDNAYDGHEDVSASVPCSPPFQRYTCGGEPGNYGNYVSKVKEANALWLSIPAPPADRTAKKPNAK